MAITDDDVRRAVATFSKVAGPTGEWPADLLNRASLGLRRVLQEFASKQVEYCGTRVEKPDRLHDDRHLHILRGLDELTILDGKYCVGFKTLSAHVGMDRAYVRLMVRRFSRMGLVSFHQGLIDEDGKFAGSGYCITQEGRNLRRREEVRIANEKGTA